MVDDNDVWDPFPYVDIDEKPPKCIYCPTYQTWFKEERARCDNYQDQLVEMDGRTRALKMQIKTIKNHCGTCERYRYYWTDEWSKAEGRLKEVKVAQDVLNQLEVECRVLHRIQAESLYPHGIQASVIAAKKPESFQPDPKADP